MAKSVMLTVLRLGGLAGLFCCIAAQAAWAQDAKQLQQQQDRLPELPAAVDTTQADGNAATSDELQRAVQQEVERQLKQRQQVRAEQESNEVTTWRKPKESRVNFLQMGGYFRFRSTFSHRCDLGTFIPQQDGEFGYGTSMCPPPLSAYSTGADDDLDASKQSHVLFSTDMRLRLDPTFHVSDFLRVHLTVDAPDNLVLGSTPSRLAFNNTLQSGSMSFLSHSQAPPLAGINSEYAPIQLKRVWAEASTPVGALRFGRMPMHFGLGLLYNAGEDINSDFSDTIDGLLFATRLGPVHIVPSYSIAFTGPAASMQSPQAAGQPLVFNTADEQGPRYDLDPKDNVHVLSLTLGGITGDPETFDPLSWSEALLHYGMLLSYRTQNLDIYNGTRLGQEPIDLSNRLQNRRGHAGFGSLFMRSEWGSWHMGTEMVGGVGVINNTSGLQADETTASPGSTDESPGSMRLLLGGAALEFDYGFLRNRLRIGLDGGWASGRSDGAGFTSVSSQVTSFSFNPAYQVDLMLFKRVLGSMMGAGYLKPHIGYFIDRFFARLDIIPSFANTPSSTPGNSNFLGLEFDATVAFHSINNFHAQLQYGLLIPFAALNHLASLGDERPQIFEQYGRAKLAHLLQLMLGISF
ncbi:MAG: TIGR04551 family protein [Myxococcota bacterium]